MPYLTSTSFDRLLERITVTGDLRGTANTRRGAISNLLKDRFTILDIFPTGSLVRGTGLKGVSDVDVIVVLHFGKHVDGKTPVQLLESVREALSQYTAKIVKKNGQAVTLYFTTWPNVDIVPAKRVGTDSNYVLNIPDANTGSWIAADPAAHDRQMASMSERGRQLVRMVKCWNGAHSGYLQSFHIERIALQTSTATATGAWGEDDWPWALKGFFEKAIDLTGPSAEISDAYGVDDWSELRSRLQRGKELAHEAWSAVYQGGNHEEAIARCGILFGDKFPAYG
jgi:hypothetical protein